MSNQALLTDLRRARGLRSAVWTQTGSGWFVTRPRVNPWTYYTAASRAGDDALLLLLSEENSAEALERCRDLTHFADCIDKTPLALDHDIAMFVRRIAFERLAVVAAGAEVGDAAPRVSRSALRQVIADLLDERAARAAFRDMVQAEALLDSLEQDAFAKRHTVTLPVIRARSAARLELFEKLATATDATCLIDSNALTGADPLSDDSKHPEMNPWQSYLREERYSRVPSESNRPWGWRSTPGFFHELMNRRMVATALACRLFQADKGRPPATLEELVPAYLPAVPANALTDGREPLEFVTFAWPDGTPRPMLRYRPSDASFADSPPDEATYVQTYSWQSLTRRETARQWRDLGLPPP